MNKTLRTTIIVSVIALMIVGLWYSEKDRTKQKDNFGKIEKALDSQKDDNARLRKRVKQLTQRTAELQIQNDLLVRKNKVLGDSLIALNGRVRVLNKKLQKQSETLTKKNAELQKLRNESSGLVDKVANLRQGKNADESLIRQLDEKRANLDKKVGRLFLQKDSLERKTLEGTAQLATLNKQFNEKERILQVVENVKITFDGIEPRKSNNKKARRLRSWDYTLINIQMNAPDMTLIQGQEFIVKIIDKDNGSILAPREASGSNDTKGEKFIFNGNPVPPIKYSNYQKKTGKNYMIQIFFLKDGKEYPLVFGAMDIDV
jgi:peptidoglycan hydrolase CwlO-like protein